MIITSENFKKEVLESDIPVLVDFWAPWCGPCRMQGPILEELEKEIQGRIKIGKINVDEESDLASEYNVASIPTLILFKNGQIANHTVGLHSKEEILELLK